MTVSRRYGKAHDRVQFKRWVRELFRARLPTLPPDFELHVSPRKKADFQTLHDDFEKLFHR